MDEKNLSFEQIQNIASKMDEYIDSDSPELENYCQQNQEKICESEVLAANLYYIVGTGYSALHRRNIHKSWFLPNISNAVYFLRKALHELKGNCSKYYKCSEGVYLDVDELSSRININLANYLTDQYRNIEAIEYYNRAVKLNNAFGLTTKAKCLIELCVNVYDENARFFLYKEAYRAVKKSLLPDSKATAEEQEQFERMRSNLVGFLEYFEDAYPDYIEVDHSESHREKFKNNKHKEYFYWVGKNSLFLNMTNIVLNKEYAYEDSLSLPSFGGAINPLLRIEEELAYHSHFDELKDTYCYARYIFFTAVKMQKDSEHLYQMGYSQIDSQDYTFNNLKTNSYKTTLRCLYSLLDKIAFFIYKFFKVKNDNLKEHEVNIGKIFLSKRKPATWLADIKNPYLSALFFLSKDITDIKRKDSDHKKPSCDGSVYLSETTFPVANQISQIRNALEHKSLKIVDEIGYDIHRNFCVKKNALEEAIQELEKYQVGSDQYLKLTHKIEEKKRLNSFHVTISIEHLEEQIIALFNLTRNALMYLSLSVHFYEMHKPHDEEALVWECEVPYKSSSR